MLLKQKDKQPGFFSQKPKNEPDLSQVYNDINEIGRRVKVMEDRYGNLQNKSQVTEQNMVARNKLLSNELKTIVMDVHELKHEIDQLKDQILTIIKELKVSAKKEEVKVLERYLNLWEPMNFVTHDEFEQMTRDVIDKMRTEQR